MPSSPSTHQDSPKVPEGIWPDGTSGSKTASFCITCGLLEVRSGRTCYTEGKKAEFTDVEIIPLSALVSDEAKAAAHRAFVDYWAGEGTWNGDPGPEQLQAMQAALQAAIQQVGGKDRG